MKLLLDQDVYAATGRLLRDLGHGVITAAELGSDRASDRELLEIARDQQRILVTRDRDFGSLVFVGGVGCGVLYLRLSPSNLRASHDELRTVLTKYSEQQLQHAFVTVEPGRHRFRKVRD